jgi:hypothetical protein
VELPRARQDSKISYKIRGTAYELMAAAAIRGCRVKCALEMGRKLERQAA